MKNYGSILVLIFGLIHVSVQQDTPKVASCNAGLNNLRIAKLMETHAVSAAPDCYQSIAEQIHAELTASVSYLAMSAYFSKAEYYRPGIAKFFLDSADEERGHAKQMIEYMLHRGGSIEDTVKFMEVLKPAKVSWAGGMEEALEDAHALEQSVTTKIVNIIDKCEKDYHSADHFTGHFLDEQHDGLRKLSGYIVTLETMRLHHGPLGDIMFDSQFNAAQ